MAKQSKRVRAVRATVDRNKAYALTDALVLVKQNATAKFDESIDVAVNLGVDAEAADNARDGVPRHFDEVALGRGLSFPACS